MPSVDADILDDLTAAQREAVTHRDGPMLVVAGAGSGKTRVVTRRIAWLIRQGVWPSQILAMTFTNKAAKEMQERVAALVGEAPANIGTFHGCCARFLRRDLDKLPCGRGRDFTIFATEDQKGVARAVLSPYKDKLPRKFQPGSLCAFISWAKNHGMDYQEAANSCDEAAGFSQGLDPALLADLATKYDDALRRCNALDFDDLLRFTVALLQDVPGMQEVYHSRFRYLLIDEYQDTNHVQYQLMRLLANERQNVHATGDPDQSIYSWRGADYRNIMSFTTDFPQAKVVLLEQNYRSTGAILDAANAVIRCNEDRIEKELFTQNPRGVMVTDILTENDRAEAEWVRKKIEGLHRRDNIAWRSFAVLYRTNAQSRPLEEEFLRQNIPHQLLGGIRFYDRKEVRDFLALLRLLANPCDQQAFLRFLEAFPQGEGLGKRTAETLFLEAEKARLPLATYLASPLFASTQKGRTAKSRRLLSLGAWLAKALAIPQTPAYRAVREAERLSGFLDHLEVLYADEDYLSRQENVKSLLGKAEEFSRKSPQGTLKELLEEVALVADVDNRDESADKVVLMTLHSAKGLEFPCVFITGVEDGLLPCRPRQNRKEEEEWELSEERRLFYVGLTRAQKAVFLSHAMHRFTSGTITAFEPSPFLQEIPDTLRQKRVYFLERELPRHDEDHPASHRRLDD